MAGVISYDKQNSVAMSWISIKALYTLATIAAEFVDYSRRKLRQFVAEFGDSRQKRRLSPPFSVTVAEFGDYSRQCGQGLKAIHYGTVTFFGVLPGTYFNFILIGRTFYRKTSNKPRSLLATQSCQSTIHTLVRHS